MKKLMKRSIGLALALCLLLTAASGFALAEGYVKTSGKVNVRTGRRPRLRFSGHGAEGFAVDLP